MPPPIASPAYNVPFFSTSDSNISVVNDISWFTGKFYYFKATVRDTLPAIGFGTVVLRVVRDFDRRTSEITETDELRFFALFVPGARWNMVVSQDMENAYVREGRNTYIRGPRNRRVALLVERPFIYPRIWLDGQDIDDTTVNLGADIHVYPTMWVSRTDRSRVNYFHDLCNSTTGSEVDVDEDHDSGPWSLPDQTWCDTNVGTKAQFFDNFDLDPNSNLDTARARHLVRRCQDVLASAEQDAQDEASAPVEEDAPSPAGSKTADKG